MITSHSVPFCRQSINSRIFQSFGKPYILLKVWICWNIVKLHKYSFHLQTLTLRKLQRTWRRLARSHVLRVSETSAEQKGVDALKSFIALRICPWLLFRHASNVWGILKLIIFTLVILSGLLSWVWACQTGCKGAASPFFKLRGRHLCTCSQLIKSHHTNENHCAVTGPTRNQTAADWRAHLYLFDILLIGPKISGICQGAQSMTGPWHQFCGPRLAQCQHNSIQ